MDTALLAFRWVCNLITICFGCRALWYLYKISVLKRWPKWWYKRKAIERWPQILKLLEGGGELTFCESGTIVLMRPGEPDPEFAKQFTTLLGDTSMACYDKTVMRQPNKTVVGAAAYVVVPDPVFIPLLQAYKNLMS